MTPDAQGAVRSLIDDIERLRNDLVDAVMDVDTLLADLSYADLYTLLRWFKYIRESLSVVEKAMTQRTADLIPKGEKVVAWQDRYGNAYTTELKWKSVRTGVRKDDLYKSVKAVARVVDNETGEVYTDADVLLQTLETAYRFEPRWSEIKALGIDPDEYCTTKYEAQIATTPANTEQETQQ